MNNIKDLNRMLENGLINESLYQDLKTDLQFIEEHKNKIEMGVY